MFVRRIPSSFIGRLASIRKQIVREASNAPLGAVTRTVHPFASIQICSKCQVTIKPYNVHECPDANLLRVSLGSTNKGESTEWAKKVDQFRPSIDIDGGNVAIDTGFQPTEQLETVECVIEVPVSANLSVSGERNVSIENSLCDTISVTSSRGNIATKSVRSKSLSLTAENGNIDCSGMTLAQQIDIRTNGNKSIRLEKVQGVTLNATTENGSISTEACYAENSNFTTTAGVLRLKNIHMNSEIRLLDGGELHLTGFHGTLNVESNASSVNLQLAEISGVSWANAKASKSFTVNISDLVEETAFIAVDVGEVILDETLNHLTEKIVNKGKLVTGNPADAENASLSIHSDGPLALGKLSWIDSFSIKLQ